MARYVIVGSGPAGISAAENIRRSDPQGSLILVGAESAGYYSRPGLAYYLTNEIPEKSLFPFSDQDFNHLAIERVTARVLAIDPAARSLRLDNQASLSYERLLIAAGAEAVGLNMSGSQSEGVVRLDALADARDMIRLSRRAHTAVVVGGGITALELVEGLAARKVKVHYLLRGERYWSNVLDEAESHIVERRLQEEGVDIHFNAELAEIQVKSGKVVGVHVRSSQGQSVESIPCEILAAAIGVRPRIQLAQAAGVHCERGILVNEYMETNLPDIYAAGDVAQVFDPFTGKSVIDSLWGPARDQGKVAGLNMAASFTSGQTPEKHMYRKGVAINVTRLARLPTTIIGGVGQGRDADLVGIARGDSEAWRYLPDAIAVMDKSEVNRLRLLVGENTILGALVMGDQSISRVIHHMVDQHMDVHPIRDQLLEPGAPLTKIILKYWQSQRKV